MTLERLGISSVWCDLHQLNEGTDIQTHISIGVQERTFKKQCSRWFDISPTREHGMHTSNTEHIIVLKKKQNKMGFCLCLYQILRHIHCLKQCLSIFGKWCSKMKSRDVRAEAFSAHNFRKLTLFILHISTWAIRTSDCQLLHLSLSKWQKWRMKFAVNIELSSYMLSFYIFCHAVRVQI